MRIRLLCLALVAMSVIGLGSSGSVAASRQGNALFLVRGELLADPPPPGAEDDSFVTALEATVRRSLPAA